MSIVIESPDGQVMFDQDRKVTENSETVTVTDSITITLPTAMHDLVDRIPFCLCPEDVTTLAGWKTFPLHQPDPGQYIVAIPFHGQIVYAVGEWKMGEWVHLFEDDKVIAFMEFEPYKGEEDESHDRG